MTDYQRLYSALLGDISDLIDALDPTSAEGTAIKQDLIQLCHLAEERILCAE